MSDLPRTIATEAELESLLTQPSEALVRFIPRARSPLVVLGAGGKMGPTLAILAKHAAEEAGHRLEVIAVSRFGDASARRSLEEKGVKTISGDLLDRRVVESLPEGSQVRHGGDLGGNEDFVGAGRVVGGNDGDVGELRRYRGADALDGRRPLPANLHDGPAEEVDAVARAAIDDEADQTGDREK